MGPGTYNAVSSNGVVCRMYDSRRPLRTAERPLKITSRKAEYAIARNADAGPWVAVKGPEANGNNTTSAIPIVAIRAVYLNESNIWLRPKTFYSFETLIRIRSCATVRSFTTAEPAKTFLCFTSDQQRPARSWWMFSRWSPPTIFIPPFVVIVGAQTEPFHVLWRNCIIAGRCWQGMNHRRSEELFAVAN